MELTTPEKAGFSSERLGRLTRRMQRYIDDGKLAGIVTLLARKGRVFHFETFGRMDLESGRAMEPDSIFRIHSMTKPIVSVALMILHENGEFQLDDPISAYLPELGDLSVCTGWAQTGPVLEPQKSPITVRHLLSHTAGFSYGDHASPAEQMYLDSNVRSRDTDLKTMIEQLSRLPLAYEPGTRWGYTDMATDVAGRLIEVLSGQTLDKYLSGKIFDPLGMVDTGFYVPEEKRDRFASIYGPSSPGATGLIEPLVQEMLDRPYDRLPPRLSGGGGLVSTTGDYSRFCQMIVNGGNLNGSRIIGPKTVELMTASHLPPTVRPFLSENLTVHTEGCGFGLGFSIVEDVARNGVAGSAGSYSWAGAANTHFWIDPAEDMYAILMTQLLPLGHYPIRAEFQSLVYQALVD